MAMALGKTRGRRNSPPAAATSDRLTSGSPKRAFFDAITMSHRWLAHLGDAAYEAMMALNRWLNSVRRLFNLPYWSLSKYAKQKVKNAVSFISKFEEVVAHEAAHRGIDGVVAGHIHKAEMRTIQGVEYYNDGDWVEGCTALVEHYDGTMEILHWADEIAARDAPGSEARLEAA